MKKLLAVLLLIPALSRADFKGKVSRVVDGDTLYVQTSSQTIEVRLWGVDCPEKKQPHGLDAKAFTVSQTTGTLRVVVKGRPDRYGRTVGVVFPDHGPSLNQRLLETGWAWWYIQYAPKAKSYARLQSQAQAAKRGLWADQDPVPPWEYRHRTKP